MNDYKFFGILFNKQEGDYHYGFVPINVVRCNPNEEDEYIHNVEFLEEVPSIFLEAFDSTEIGIGFTISKEDLLKKYDTNNIEEAATFYRDEICSFSYIQKYDDENDATITYKIDLDDFNITEIARYKDDVLTFEETELLTKTKVKNVIQLEKEVIKEKEVTKEKIDILEEKKSNLFDIKTIYEKVTESVIGQDDALKKVITILDRNKSISNYRNKTNILIIGNSGTGKTEICRSIEQELQLPMIIEDSEQYSATGYVGSSISDMLINLYNKAGKDLTKAENGILVIDEIDKKVTSSKDDVSGNRVLNSLLSLMEGTTFRINTGDEFRPNYINFNTEKTTVILLGAFSDLVKKETSEIGFNKDINKKNIEYSKIKIDDLVKYGLTPELLRRLSVITLNKLTKDDFIEIMKKSKNSVLTSYQEYAESKNIKLKISDEAINLIAEEALSLNVGVSGIKAIFNKILDDAFFEISFNSNTYSSIIVNEETIKQEPPYQLTYRKQKRTTKM